MLIRGVFMMVYIQRVANQSIFKRILVDLIKNLLYQYPLITYVILKFTHFYALYTYKVKYLLAKKYIQFSEFRLRNNEGRTGADL